MSIRSSAIVATAVAAMLGVSAQGAELLLNGDFESGTLTGWTEGVASTWGVSDANTMLDTGLQGNPFDTYDANNGFNTTTSLYQDVTIPSGYNAVLTTNHRITWVALDDETPVDRTFAIAVQDLTNNLPEQLLYITSIIAVPDPEFDVDDSGWVQNTFNLSAYAGLNVRVRFHEIAFGNDTVLASLELDDISLMATTIPEPTSLAMLGIGAMFMRRRRSV